MLDASGLRTAVLRYAGARAPGGQAFREATSGADTLHAYPWKRQTNGQYRVEKIDIFRACKRLNPHTKKVDDFDRAWMDRAVRMFKAQAENGYYPPVQLDHSTRDGVSRPFAGLIDNLWVENDKQGVPILWASLRDMPPVIFGRCALNRVPYRSIEVPDPDSGGVGALALMETTQPFHKLPVTSFDVSNPSGTFRAPKGATGSPLCFSQYGVPDPDTGGRFAVVQHFNCPGCYAPMGKPTAARQLFERPDQAPNPDDFTGDDDESLQALLAALGESGGGEDMDDDGAPDAGVEDGADDGAAGAAGDEAPADVGGDAAGAAGSMPAPGGAPAPGADDPEMAQLAAEDGMGVSDMSGKIDQLLAAQAQTNNAINSLAQAMSRNAPQPSPPPTFGLDTGSAIRFLEAQGMRIQAPAAPVAPAAAPAATPKQIMVDADEYNRVRAAAFAAFDALQEMRLRAGINEEAGRYVYGDKGSLVADGYSEQQIAEAVQFCEAKIDADIQRWKANEITHEDIDPAAHFVAWRQVHAPDTGSTKLSLPPRGPRSTAGTSSAGGVDPLEAVAVRFCQADPEAKAVFSGVDPASVPDEAIAVARAAQEFREQNLGAQGFSLTAKLAGARKRARANAG